MKTITIDQRFKRIRDLPIDEREPFNSWLWGQARPSIPWEQEEEQDGYYEHDYERWLGEIVEQTGRKITDPKIVEAMKSTLSKEMQEVAKDMTEFWIVLK